MVAGGLYGFQQWLDRQAQTEKAAAAALDLAAEPLAQAQDHYRSLRDLKELDVAQFKAGFSDLARSRKTLFEAGLSLQEERRLLEKQLEIMTTYLTMDPALRRIFLMRGEQPLESYPVAHIPPRVFPALGPIALEPATPTVAIPGPRVSLPETARIISKERFAHPERGHSEQVDGELLYNPPQVGTSVRSNALGQYVMFTNSKLILHGPPVLEEDHEKFPHLCLGLDSEAARKLYRGSFIGTKILLKSIIAAGLAEKQ